MAKAKKTVDPFIYHQIRIAKQTLKLHPSMVAVMGGMTVETAKRILQEHQEKGEES